MSCFLFSEEIGKRRRKKKDEQIEKKRMEAVLAISDRSRLLFAIISTDYDVLNKINTHLAF
jgi:hypothetical protein